MLRRLTAWLAILWAGLFDVTQSPARYLRRALLVDLSISMPIAIAVGLTFPSDTPDFRGMSPLFIAIMICVVSPLVETLMMVVLFAGLRLFLKGQVPLAIVSCLLWAGLHSLSAPAWGLGVFWPFLIFSICYLNWETRSRRHAIYMTAALHALHNLVPSVLLLVGTAIENQ
ncbi:hypothetical protein Verru16b_03091 [Lacunisphaera limnophila]|uniref:CAAX prenyl protease 2/Lysostaphin resistance protein A-like domain-containing protein n=1 Tax=Lacunisphaera limnophila TaxID=1838286 RepID=A0A1D8AYM7_9BACT|nr:hypothetical protein Verru16b_03091 [Lacunisphaera limnophila]